MKRWSITFCQFNLYLSLQLSLQLFKIIRLVVELININLIYIFCIWCCFFRIRFRLLFTFRFIFCSFSNSFSAFSFSPPSRYLSLLIKYPHKEITKPIRPQTFLSYSGTKRPPNIVRWWKHGQFEKLQLTVWLKFFCLAPLSSLSWV